MMSSEIYDDLLTSYHAWHQLIDAIVPLLLLTVLAISLMFVLTYNFTNISITLHLFLSEQLHSFFLSVFFNNKHLFSFLTFPFSCIYLLYPYFFSPKQ